MRFLKEIKRRITAARKSKEPVVLFKISNIILDPDREANLEIRRYPGRKKERVDLTWLEDRGHDKTLGTSDYSILLTKKDRVWNVNAGVTWLSGWYSDYYSDGLSLGETIEKLHLIERHLDQENPEFRRARKCVLGITRLVERIGSKR